MLVLIIELCGMVVRLLFLGWQLRKAEKRSRSPDSKGPSLPVNYLQYQVGRGVVEVHVS